MTYSDTNVMDNIIRIGKSRERRVYYRKDGTPTKPLPADAQSLIGYLSKGFTLDPPNDVKDGIKCPLCRNSFANIAGLKIHLRDHEKKESN